jgi:hypothetical protein
MIAVCTPLFAIGARKHRVGKKQRLAAGDAQGTNTDEIGD